MNRILSQKSRRLIEWSSILAALLGLTLMFQPFLFPLFLAGFWLLFIGGLLYISTTFWYDESLTVSAVLKTALKVLLTVAVVLAVAVSLVPILL